MNDEKTLTTNTNPCDDTQTWAKAPAPSKMPLTSMAWAIDATKSGFGCLRDGGTKFHAGIDIKAPVGTTCYATEDGKVEELGYGDDVGSYVTISFKKGGKTYGAAYCHLSKRTAKKGDPIKAGDIIGETGISGNADASNPHLHLEVQNQIWTGYADAAERSKHSLDPNDYI